MNTLIILHSLPDVSEPISFTLSPHYVDPVDGTPRAVIRYPSGIDISGYQLDVGYPIGPIEEAVSGSVGRPVKFSYCCDFGGTREHLLYEVWSFRDVPSGEGVVS